MKNNIDDHFQRRALLLHLGDVLEAIACVMKNAHHYNTVGNAIAQEDALVDFAILGFVDLELSPTEFVKCASNAFFLWPKELLEEELNHKLLGHLVQHDLFAGNQVGWNNYMQTVQRDVPWFGSGLGAVPEPNLEPSKTTWPPVLVSDEPPSMR